jgi:predicted ATP-grasp superfamily ATP-dependent carboligase
LLDNAFVMRYATNGRYCDEYYQLNSSTMADMSGQIYETKRWENRVEEALKVPLLEWHTAGCRQQSLPMLPDRHDQNVFGKAIVYARRDGTLPDTIHWLAKGRRDVPHAGGPINAGFPICTVTAVGRDQEQCYAQLLAEADELLKMA